MSDENRTESFDIVDEPRRDSDDASKHEDRTAKSNGAPKPVVGIGTIDPFDIPNAGIDATDAGNAGSVGNQPKRRGRPPGSKNRTSGTETQKTVQRDISVNLEELLLSIHCMGAAFLKSPELELDDDEAKKIAHHLKKVSELYNHQFDPRTLVWGGLIFAFLEVYGTRGVAIYKRVTEETPEKPKPGKPTLVPDTRQPPQPAQPNTRIENPSQLWPTEPIEDN